MVQLNDGEFVLCYPLHPGPTGAASALSIGTLLAPPFPGGNFIPTIVVPGIAENTGFVAGLIVFFSLADAVAAFTFGFKAVPDDADPTEEDDRVRMPLAFTWFSFS